MRLQAKLPVLLEFGRSRFPTRKLLPRVKIDAVRVQSGMDTFKFVSLEAQYTRKA
jgi:hypothetical protein